MNCPRCESASLVEIDRDGVTVDRCRDCRGVWLDRGELEKLIARASREEEEDDRRDRARGRDDRDDRDERRVYHEDRHDDSHDEDRRTRRGRKRSWLDVFDFD